jgi:hypothetical protein
LRIAFPPYDFLILISSTFLLGILIKNSIFKNHSYQKGTDRLFPYAFAYIPITIIFIYVFEELPVKFFLHDDYYINETPQMSPQGLPIDEKRVFALVYNFIIWVFFIIVIIRHFLIRNKLTKN